MTATDAADHVFVALGRVFGFALLIVGGAVALAFAAAAAIVAGLMVLGAALALRFTPRPRAAGGAEMLDARQTPNGWVVESVGRRKV